MSWAFSGETDSSSLSNWYCLISRMSSLEPTRTIAAFGSWALISNCINRSINIVRMGVLEVIRGILKKTEWEERRSYLDSSWRNQRLEMDR